MSMFQTHFVKDSGLGIKEAAKRNLEKMIDEGLSRTRPVLEEIMSTSPVDHIVSAPHQRFIVTEDVAMGTESDGFNSMHRHAFSQTLSRLGIPRAYGQELLDTPADDVETDWRRNLLENILEQHAAHQNDRWLVRKVNGQVRGVLSDRFRRLDSQPLLMAFNDACNKVGAVPVEGISNDVKQSVKAIIPRVVEPMQGEAMVLGLEWSNSDFGAGTYRINFFATRLVCLNGMVTESSMRQVHLGGRLPDDLILSDKTYEHDTNTMASMTGDVVRGMLSESAIEERMTAIREANAKQIDPNKAIASLRASLPKSERAELKQLMESGESVLLPKGNTKWRLSNALSWMANKEDQSPSKRMDLQWLAGKVLN